MKEEISPDVRAYMSRLGKSKSEKKIATARANAAKGAAAARKPVESYACTCGGCPQHPKSTCPRGRVIRRRQKANSL